MSEFAVAAIEITPTPTPNMQSIESGKDRLSAKATSRLPSRIAPPTSTQTDGLRMAAMNSAAESAPMPTAAMRRPYPVAPTWSTSRAIGGTDDAEVDPERRDEADHDDRQEDDGRVPHVAEALGQVGEDAADGCRARDPWRRVQLAQTHHPEAGDHRDEAEPVEEEGLGHPEDADRETCHGRANDTCRIEHRRVERDRVVEVLAAHHLDDERLASGHVERLDAAQQEREHEDLPDLDQSGRDERRERECQDHQDGLGGHERPALRQMIGDEPAEQAEDQHRRELRRGDEAEVERIVRQLEDEPVLGDGLHPRPDQRDQLPEPEEPVVAMVQRVPDAQLAESRDRPHRQQPADDRAVMAPAPRPSLSARSFSRNRSRRDSASPSIVASRSIFACSTPTDRSTRASESTRTWRRTAGSSVARYSARLVARAVLVFEELADLGEREAGHVAQLADVADSLHVRRVVQAVVAVGAGGRLEKADLLVIPHGSGRGTGLGCDLLDSQEGRTVRRLRRRGWRRSGLGCRDHGRGPTGGHDDSLPQPYRLRKG